MGKYSENFNGRTMLHVVIGQHASLFRTNKLSDNWGFGTSVNSPTKNYNLSSYANRHEVLKG